MVNFIWSDNVRKMYYCMLGFLFISACNNQQPPQNSAEEPAKNTAMPVIDKPTKAEPLPIYADGTFCFKNTLNQDVTNIQLIISGSSITGFMNWVPYQKDSARGTLTGTKNADGELDLMYDYVIEGSHQTETKVMKITNEKLWIKKGELIDAKNDGHLVYKDVSQASYDESIEKADCESLTE